MEVLFFIFFFALGAIVASFVGVLVERFNAGLAIAHDRSRCDSCGRELGPIDLIPIVSYLLTRGRARCCSTRIAPTSTITELILGALFALSYAKVGISPVLPFLLVSLSALSALVLYDLRHMILPPQFLAVFLVGALGLALVSVEGREAFLLTLMGALPIAFFLALIHVVSRGRAMGLSDAPLVFGLALLAGPAALSGFIFSFWIGAIVGITLLAKAPKGARMGIEVPFAPFLAAGFLLAYFTSWDPFIIIGQALTRFLGA